MREYAPGDRIRFNIEFAHRVNIPRENVWAVFSYTGSEQTNLPELVIPGIIAAQTIEEGHTPHKSSLARFESEPVGISIHPGGVYALTRVVVKTYGGVEMDVTGMIPTIQFRLPLGEPTDWPVEFETFDWDS